MSAPIRRGVVVVASIVWVLRVTEAMVAAGALVP